MIDGIQMIGLFVRDFDAALHFYRDLLGIPLAVDPHGAYHHAEYSFRDPYFHFALFPQDTEHTGRAAAHVAFTVADCRKAFASVTAAGAVVVHAPRYMTYSSGGLSAEILDPDGNHVELFEPQQS